MRKLIKINNIMTICKKNTCIIQKKVVTLQPLSQMKATSVLLDVKQEDILNST